MGRVILIILAAILIIALVAKFFFLLVAGALGYWAYKQYKKNQLNSKKQTSSYVISAFAGLSLIIFLVSFTNEPAPTASPTSVNTTVETPTDKVEEETPEAETTEVVNASKDVTNPEETPKEIEEANNNVRLPATLIEVTDGDTLKVEVEGREEKVRLLLIDTPETVHPDKEEQPFGKDASNFVKKQVAKGKIELELDVSERDKYGRLLAYVWINDKMLNEQLLEYGLARVAISILQIRSMLINLKKFKNQPRKKLKEFGALKIMCKKKGS